MLKPQQIFLVFVLFTFMHSKMSLNNFNCMMNLTELKYSNSEDISEITVSKNVKLNSVCQQVKLLFLPFNIKQAKQVLILMNLISSTRSDGNSLLISIFLFVFVYYFGIFFYGSINNIFIFCILVVFKITLVSKTLKNSKMDLCFVGAFPDQFLSLILRN